ncbi:MAG TPA: DUF5706 domain-containing protein [Saprospiraceae bacterium]|nr:DUF5706 domain-containing protein [Saprospiraceae bacterium]HNT19472.1 DUF5706 domain-containing protein [Saprospiraceae bacterium]
MAAILQEAKNYVKDLLTSQLNGTYWYHNWEHTEYVFEEAMALGESAGLSESEKEILGLSALFHDTGFVKAYQDHVSNSKVIAKEYLLSRGYGQEQTAGVLENIEATRMPHTGTGKLGALLQDADLALLASEDAIQKSENLRRELAVFENKHFSDAEWVKHNLDFYKAVVYQTAEGKRKYEAGKEKIRDILKEKNKKSKKDESSLINSNRTAEMLFKTALRNHINLTQIADNKSNIMLSINALIVTFALPLMYEQMQSQQWYFLIPVFILGGTCLISIIYAALATRPGTVKGKFNLADIQAGKGSLFFFGNFFKTPLKDYIPAMKQALAKAENLDDSAIIDLYFLGKSVGLKFELLRKCYSFFLVGITLSSVLFGIVFIIQAIGNQG